MDKTTETSRGREYRSAGQNEARAAHRPQVFSDPGRQRSRRVRAFAVMLASFTAGWVGIFAANLYNVEKLPGISLLQAEQVPAGAAIAAVPPGGREAVSGPSVCVSSPYPPIFDSSASDVVILPTEEVYAYLPYQPDSTFVSYRAWSAEVDVLLPEWYRLDPGAARIAALDRTDETQTYLTDEIARQQPRVKVMPVVTLSAGSLTDGDDEAQAARRTALALQIAGIAERESAAGICLAPRGFDPEIGGAALVDLLGQVTARLSAQDRVSCIVAGMTDRLVELPGLVDVVDRVVLKSFHEPWIGDPPGPLAAEQEFDDAVTSAINHVGRGKLVVMLGSFAVDWSRGEPAPEMISLPEAWRRAVENGGTLDFPFAPRNMRVRYRDGAGSDHEIWALDAASLYNQMSLMSDHELRRVGLYPLGFEDPSARQLFSIDSARPDRITAQIASVDVGDFVSYEGEGAFQMLHAPSRTGQRSVELDPENGRIIAESLDPIARPWVIQRYGRAATDRVAITFDDGPDAEYTEGVLDVLADRKAPATFFVVGTNVLRNPALVQRMMTDGHLVGSHTFMHTRLDEVPPLRTKIELNAMQRLLGVVTGHQTVLFRTPYGRGEGPIIGSSAAPMADIEDGGYIIVGSEVVPPDWLKLDTDQIVDNIMTSLSRGDGNVIVMHDAGGDRQATVDALGPLIDRLRADGYDIVSLADLIGVAPGVLMPAAGGAGMLLDKMSFGMLGIASDWLVVLVLVAVALGALRATTILILAHLRRPHRVEPPPETDEKPQVTVLIPAFNEETTILRCIESVFDSDYPNIHAIVVDDGSTDQTFEVVAERAAHDERLRLIRQPNGGKWHALDRAYELAVATDIVVAIDADSLIAPDAVTKLVRHFADPTVGAVAGRVRVGNRTGLLTRLQVLEYTVAQNIDRRAMELFNGMLVVPGAIGAWRADVVRRAGLYSSETVAEDADLTISVIRQGYRVVYEEDAYAATEAPESVDALMRQRLRWSFGMLQAAAKHIGGAIRERRAIGLISLPDLLIVGYALSLLAPLADIVLFGTLFDLAFDHVLGRPDPLVDMRWTIIAGYMVLPLFDLLIIALALRFDRTESAWLLLLFPLQRFFYRPLLYVTAWRAMIRATFGRLTSWGKLTRTGTAQLAIGRTLAAAE